MPSPNPGLEGVVACETTISTLAHGLHYRGYSIDDVALHCCYEEVAYLLLYGELPTAVELQALQERLLLAAQQVSPQLIEIVRGLPHDAPLIDVLRTGCSLLAHYDPDVAANDRAANLRKAERLLAQLPVVLAAAARARHGLPALSTTTAGSLAENFLVLFTGQRPAPHLARALDIAYINYADHEMNASTFTARVTASTQADLHAAITAAIGALKGPLHGGANALVLNVFEQIGPAENTETWVRNALANKVRIMGFGHRVYKEGDPRQLFMKPVCQRLAEQTGNMDFERRADAIERVMYELKPQLPPNVDWAAARVFKYLGLPVDLYTPLFALARVAGWSAQVIEQLGRNRLIRPEANYIGPPPRAVVPIAQR